MADSGSSKRGFAAMSAEKQREIARKGGKASGANRQQASRRSSQGSNS
jgi:general stress protein YciG